MKPIETRSICEQIHHELAKRIKETDEKRRKELFDELRKNIKYADYIE